MYTMKNPLLSVSDLHVEGLLPGAKKIAIVKGVSFSLMPGETLGIVGESGSGKTTLAKGIMRLMPASAGEVNLDGNAWLSAKGATMTALRRSMQMVFQDPFASLDPRQTIGSAIMEPMIHKKRSEKLKFCEELLNQVGLSQNHMWKFPHEFSGGQLQRVGIARALALKPRLIFADEPVSALDVSIRAQILNLFRDLQKELNLGLVFISHDLALVRYMAQNIAVMYAGKFVEFGNCEDVCTNPSHPYTKMLIGSIPNPDPQAQQFQYKAQTKENTAVSGCAYAHRCAEATSVCFTPKPPPVVTTAAGVLVQCHSANR